MCFEPQRCALFQHLNFQNWSEREVFLAFSLANVLRAKTACTFRHLNFKKCSGGEVLLAFSQFFTCKCASRHNGVQFFISHLASWLRTRRFSEPTFRPSGASNYWKNTVVCDFPTFSHTWIFFFLTLSLSSSLLFSSLLFSSLTLPISAFHLSILSEAWLLNFLRWYQHFFKRWNSADFLALSHGCHGSARSNTFELKLRIHRRTRMVSTWQHGDIYQLMDEFPLCGLFCS